MPAAAETRLQVAPTRGIAYKVQIVAYWVFTLLVGYEMVAGAFWDLLKLEYIRVVLESLQFPEYVAYVIGIWKLPCAIALIVPGFLRVKEWAYAGACFNYYGAVASHYLHGDSAARWVTPLFFVAFTLASWALRPEDRRLPSMTAPSARRLASWIVPAVLLVGLTIAALLTLPKGPPPG